MHITATAWGIDRRLLLGTNRKSTATLHFTLSNTERPKSGLFRFCRIVVCKGAELGCVTMKPN